MENSNCNAMFLEKEEEDGISVCKMTNEKISVDEISNLMISKNGFLTYLKGKVSFTLHYKNDKSPVWDFVVGIFAPKALFNMEQVLLTLNC